MHTFNWSNDLSAHLPHWLLIERERQTLLALADREKCGISASMQSSRTKRKAKLVITNNMGKNTRQARLTWFRRNLTDLVGFSLRANHIWKNGLWLLSYGSFIRSHRVWALWWGNIIHVVAWLPQRSLGRASCTFLNYCFIIIELLLFLVIEQWIINTWPTTTNSMYNLR